MVCGTLNIAEIPSLLIGLDQSTRLLHKEGYVKFFKFNINLFLIRTV